MGVLQRFERRLEGFVEGAFARVFGGVVQPVEIAAALQREAADKKAIVGAGRGPSSRGARQGARPGGAASPPRTAGAWSGRGGS